MVYNLSRNDNKKDKQSQKYTKLIQLIQLIGLSPVKSSEFIISRYINKSHKNTF